jgi:hypothetical protein
MLGFSSLQKCTTALRMLAYGPPGDSHDDYIRMAEFAAMEFMSRFYRAVVSVFGSDYLRTPMKKTLLAFWPRMQSADFLGCLVASIACIGNGRTVCLLGRIYTKVTKEVEVWY